MPELGAVVEAYLRNARELLGAGNLPPTPAPGESIPQPRTPPGWSGSAQQRAADQTADMDRMRHQTDNVKAQVHNEIAQSQSVGPRALGQLKAVEAQWATDRATLSSQRGTPEAAAGLAQAGQHRAVEARQIVSAAAADYAQSAEAVRAAGRQLPLAHVDPNPPSEPQGTSDDGTPNPDDDRPYMCFLGSKGNDPVKVCGPIPALHTYYVDNGRFVQIEGGKPGPAAEIEISAGPGDIIDTFINPRGEIDEVVVWMAGPPSPQDFDKWSDGGERCVNFRWQNPDGSIAVDRRRSTGESIHRGAIPPGLDLSP